MADPELLRTVPVYPCTDVDRSIEWYRDVLGLEAVHVNPGPEVDHPTNYAVLVRGDVSLHLVRDVEQDFGKTGPCEAMFEVTSGIDDLFAALVEGGARVMRPIQGRPWGARDFTILDPDGNAVWLSETK
ncbi:MAG: VOC family protein [Deltaproteobacteria bacterium]|nr:VOC family protein [Deltaproteobacteria bacterium]MBW2415415.1 VOC family protein [Deltaproteobacteria bacterium]